MGHGKSKMALRLCWSRTALLFIYLILSCVFGYNIDTKIPVIKTGQSGSYFGFSVAEHINNQHLLLVGAPLYSNNITSNGPKTGAVYKCNVRSMDPGDCQLIKDIDNVFSSDGEKADQWLGSTISSTSQAGKKVLVCAHRFTVNYVGIGTCLTLTSDLTPEDERRPCRDDGLENAGLAYCQAGTSGVMMTDESILLGAPGAVDWTGSLWTQYTGDDITQDLTWFRSAIYLKEDNRKPRPIDLTSYMGFSVTYGRFEPNRVSYVGGAPRSVSMGQVVIFGKNDQGLTYRNNQILTGEKAFSAFGYSVLAMDLNGDSYDDLIVGSPMYLETDKSIGGAIYIYMGSDSEMITKDSVPIKITSRKMSEDECMKLKCKDARFGHTLANAGDINNDGYQDLVVAAPYEGIDKGAIYLFHGSRDGLIQEYVQRIYAADIDTSPPLQAFGYSISGGQDMDGNGYDDIAVGAYESEHAVLLRTRPIVHLDATISIAPKKFNLSETPLCYDGTKKHCIVMSFLISYFTEPPRRTPLNVIYTVEADVDKQTKRVEFKNPTPGFGGKIENSVDILMPEQPEIFKHTIYLKENFQDKLRPVKFKASYRLPEENWPTRSKRQASFPDINDFPVLQLSDGSAAVDIVLETSIEFAKECGANDICESDLSLRGEVQLDEIDDATGYPVLTDIGSELVVKFTVENRGEPAYQTMFYILVPEEFEYRITRAVSGSFQPECSVYNKTLLVCGGLGNPLSRNQVRVFTITFETQNLDPKTRFFSMTAFINTTSAEQTPEDTRNLPVKVVTRTNLIVYGSAVPDADVIYSGDVRGESAISTIQQIGPAINHSYVVINDGDSTVGRADLFIEWPYEMAPKLQGHSGKHLLYLVDIELNGLIDCSSIDPAIFNVLNAETNNAGYTLSERRKRQVNGKSEAGDGETEGKKDDSPHIRLAEQRERMKKVITLSCKEQNVRCHQLRCNILTLGPDESVSIKFVARLWESTLLEDYPAVDMVQIQSKATVVLDPELNIEQPSEEDDFAIATTYTIPDVASLPAGEVAWWIILVAVLGGIVLLVVLILLLFLCGFFKRIRPKKTDGYEPTYRGEIISGIEKDGEFKNGKK